MSFAVVLAAAGRSSRFGETKLKKPFLDLAGQPVWLRALEPFLGQPDVSQILISVSPDEVDWFISTFSKQVAEHSIQVIPGGAERFDSVQNALNAVSPNIEYIAVHDAARPLLTVEVVEQVFAAARTHGAAIPAHRVVNTLKRVADGRIIETVPRDDLWNAQTPQTFRRNILLAAYAARNDFPATDEAQLVERWGHPVHVVECPSTNLKITTKADFALAEHLLASS
ncbi:MAG: 2-C-methyl-D-erythritol 4-phosphate cytidylyltransferase [Planctomycetaceae bacterium]